MAGIKLVTDVEPDKGLQLAWRLAQDLGFKLTTVKDSAFQASKGNALLSFVAGAVAPHCQFTLSARHYGDNTTDLVLEWSGSWTNGLLGRRNSQREADALMTKVAEALQTAGNKVIERKEI